MNKKTVSIAIILLIALVLSIVVFFPILSAYFINVSSVSPNPSNAVTSPTTTPSHVSSSPSTVAASPTIIPNEASPTSPTAVPSPTMIPNPIIVEKVVDTYGTLGILDLNVNVTKVVVKNIGENDVTITSLTLIYVGVRNESQNPVPVLVQVPAKSTVEIPTLIPLLRYGDYSWLGYCIMVQTDRGYNATSPMGILI